jgi:hypothetical protein
MQKLVPCGAVLAGEAKWRATKRCPMHQTCNDAASLHCRNDAVSLRFPQRDEKFQCLTPPLNCARCDLLVTPT